MAPRLVAHQHRADQRTGGDIEARLDRLRALGRQRPLAVRGVERDEVELLGAQGRRARHPQLGAVGADRRMQGLVALAQQRQRRVQRGGIQRALEPQRGRFVVGQRGFGAELVGQPDLALRLGGRDDALHLARAERIMLQRHTRFLHIRLAHFLVPSGARRLCAASLR